MGNALFYHLTRSPAEVLAPVLIGKARAAGWRVEVRGTDRAAAQRLDERLWEVDGFLPHGLAGGPHDARQPILLTWGDAGALANAPACLVAIGGAEVTPGECHGLERVCILFDGGDPAATERARDQWRLLTGGGVTAEYWAEDGGRWERKR